MTLNDGDRLNFSSLFMHIDDHGETYLDELRDMVRVASVSALGEHLDEMAEKTAAKLESAGCRTQLLRAGGPPVVWAEVGPQTGPTLLFYDHYDVQPAEPLADWDSPPFEPTLRDGRLFGRGVNDNKGNLTSRICALQAWRDVVGELPCRIRFLIEGDEEIGSPHLGSLLDAHEDRFRADACIWEGGGVDWQGAPQLSIGMKGMLSVELSVRNARTEIHSRDSVRVVNPAWRLVWALSTLKDQRERCLVPGFYSDVRQPTELENAAVRAIPSDEASFSTLVGINGYVLGLTGDALKVWTYFQPTCNISGFTSGYTGPGAKTIVPPEARSRLDFRLVPDQDPQAILDALRSYLTDGGFNDVEVAARDHGVAGYRTQVDHPFVRLVTDAAAEVYTRPAVVLPTGTGSGPLALVAGRFHLPVATAGSGNPESRNHCPNENIRVADYLLGIKHVVAIIERMGRGPDFIDQARP